MKYVFHPAALTEYAEAVQYYAQNRTQLAQAFIDAVENTIYRRIGLLLGCILNFQQYKEINYFTLIIGSIDWRSRVIHQHRSSIYKY
jgi:hypothetical protein